MQDVGLSGYQYAYDLVGFPVDVQLSSTLSFLSRTSSFAPGISFSPVMSYLLMDTLVFALYRATSLAVPFALTVNVMSFAL